MGIYEVIKNIFWFVGMLGLVMFWVFAVIVVVYNIKKNKAKAKRAALFALLGIVLCAVGLIGGFAVAVKQYKDVYGEADTIKNEIISDKEDYQKFIYNVDNYLMNCNFQGSILVAKDDEIVIAKGYGLSDEMNPDSDENTIHSTYEIGSITKQMTAAAILQLEDEGLLDTSDKISKYFPDYRYGDRITIDMLLHMRSGLQDHLDDLYSFYPKEIADELWDAELNNRPVEEDVVLKYMGDVPLKTENSRFDYCNLNYYLLACIIEQVSGGSYDDYIKTHIFDVCDMDESNLDFQGTTTKAYDGSGRYYSIPKSTVKGAGEVNSSVIDLYKWDYNLVNGKVLSDNAYTKMITPEGEYACGLYVGGNTIMHGGCTDVYNSYNVVYFKDSVYIIVLANKPIDKISTTAIAGNIRKFWDGCY